MEEDTKTVTLMSPTSFVAEIMLVLMGLSGVSLIGVHIGYFYSLSLLFVSLGLSIGLLTILICIIGIYVLLYQNYQRLKFFLTFLTIFIGLQLAFIIHLYFFTNNIDITDQQQGSIIALDVCFGFSASALIALCLHLKQKGSTIEMVKL
jgi:cytochrome c biogenesis protein CcdA